MDKSKVQEQALTELNKHNRGTIALSMGVGKTLLGLKHMVDNYTDVFKALVVAPKLSIFDSWKDDAEKFNLSYLLSYPMIRFIDDMSSPSRIWPRLSLGLIISII